MLFVMCLEVTVYQVVTDLDRLRRRHRHRCVQVRLRVALKTTKSTQADRILRTNETWSQNHSTPTRSPWQCSRVYCRYVGPVTPGSSPRWVTVRRARRWGSRTDGQS